MSFTASIDPTVHFRMLCVMDTINLFINSAQHALITILSIRPLCLLIRPSVRPSVFAFICAKADNILQMNSLSLLIYYLEVPDNFCIYDWRVRNIYLRISNWGHQVRWFGKPQIGRYQPLLQFPTSPIFYNHYCIFL